MGRKVGEGRGVLGGRLDKAFRLSTHNPQGDTTQGPGKRGDKSILHGHNPRYIIDRKLTAVFGLHILSGHLSVSASQTHRSYIRRHGRTRLHERMHALKRACTFTHTLFLSFCPINSDW